MINNNAAGITAALNRMIVTSGFESKTFEIIGSEITPVIITGQDDEKTIEPFMGPILFELQGRSFVALDLRNNIRSSNIGKHKLTDMINSVEHYDFELTRLLAKLDALESPLSNKVVSKPIIQSISILISKSLAQSNTLSLLEETNVHVLTQHYFASLFLKVGDTRERDISRKLETTLPKLSLSFKDRALSQYGTPMTLDEWIESIKSVSPKLRDLNTNFIATLLSRSAIVPNQAYNAFLIMEDIPTIMAYIEAATQQRMNSRSIFNSAISKIDDVDRVHEYNRRLVEKYIP